MDGIILNDSDDTSNFSHMLKQGLDHEEPQDFQNFSPEPPS